MIYGQPNSPLPNWCAALGLRATVCCTPTLKSSEIGLKISGLNRDSNDYKPIDAEIEDNNTGIFHVFETQILSYQDPHFKHGLIDLFHNGDQILYSFVLMLISPISLTAKGKILKII